MCVCVRACVVAPQVALDPSELEGGVVTQETLQKKLDGQQAPSQQSQQATLNALTSKKRKGGAAPAAGGSAGKKKPGKSDFNF